MSLRMRVRLPRTSDSNGPPTSSPTADPLQKTSSVRSKMRVDTSDLGSEFVGRLDDGHALGMVATNASLQVDIQEQPCIYGGTRDMDGRG